MKKILSMMLVLAVMMSICLPLSAFADDNCTHEWEYEAIPDTETHKATCSICGEQKTEDCTLPDGSTSGHCVFCDNAIAHTDSTEWFHDAKDHWHKCPLNDDKKVLKAEHTFGTWTIIKEATEDIEGEKVRTCSVCGATETASIDKLEHVHSYTSIIHAPTCTEQGYTEKVCSKCNDVQKVDYVDATGHKWGEWKTTKYPTEQEAGEMIRICSVCKISDIKEVPKQEHVHEVSKELKGKVDATCMKDGYTGDEVCAKCGEILKKGSVIKATGHDEKNAKIVNKKDATCTEDGYSGDTVCPKCNEVLKKGLVIKAKGHDEKNAKIENKKDATCKKDGYTGDTVCPVCKKVIKKGETIKKLGHDFDKNGICKRCKADQKNPDTGDKTGLTVAASIFIVSVMGLVALGGFALYKKFSYKPLYSEKD